MGRLRLDLSGALGIYLCLLALLIPMPYSVLPDIGGLLRPAVDWLLWQVFGREYDLSDWQIYSDSLGMRTLFVAALLPALVSGLLPLPWYRARRIIRAALLYYLALQLLRYGLAKVSLSQFATPEANLLLTPFGSLDADVRYWSVIGSAPAYQVFLGVIECAVGGLLFSRRWRWLGLVGSLAVMLHVLVTDLAFGIDVVLFSGLLLAIAVYLSVTYYRRMVSLTTDSLRIDLRRKNMGSSVWRLARPLLIVAIVIESAWPHAYIGGPELTAGGVEALAHKLYDVSGSKEWQRLILHSEGYLIMQDSGGEMHSTPIIVDARGQRLLSPKRDVRLEYTLDPDGHLSTISGRWAAHDICWQLEAEYLSDQGLSP